MLQDKDTIIFSEINSFFISSEKAMETIFSFHVLHWLFSVFPAIFVNKLLML